MVVLEGDGALSHEPCVGRAEEPSRIEGMRRRHVRVMQEGPGGIVRRKSILSRSYVWRAISGTSCRNQEAPYRL